MKTPLEQIIHLTQFEELSCRVKRDDLLPMLGGGNKVRKAKNIFRIIIESGHNAVVTTGGIQSNHARVTALFAASIGWKCKLILHSNHQESIRPQGNLLLMQLSGAELEIVSPSNIECAMRMAMEDLRSDGLNPYMIPGGGHSIAGAMAYIEATEELRQQCEHDDWYPDWIILASGTGTTQAGIIVGLDQIGWDTNVVGISVARKNPRGRAIIEKMCKELKIQLGITNFTFDIDFRDDWVGKGYEIADERVIKTIREVAKSEGLILDPTYTGKAFIALLDMINSGEIEKGSNVLFWHTGGLLNLMASEYFIKSGLDV